MSQLAPQATLTVAMTSFSSERIVTAISRLVSEFCRVILADADVASRFHMAAHELAENVVKYSTGPRVSIEVALEEFKDGARLEVRASNETTPERLQEVEGRLRELAEAEDPVALYDRLIMETAPRTDVSGLGLARIRAEGELNMDYSIEGNALTVTVHAPVTTREGS